MAKPYPVVFIITDLLIGGAEVMLYKLLSNLDLSLFSPEVISLSNEGPLADNIRSLGIQVHNLKMQPGHPNLTAFCQLISWLKKKQPAIIQTWMYHADLIGGLAALFAVKSPVVWSIRNSSLDLHSIRLSTYIIVRICAFLSRWIPEYIVVNSENARAEHVKAGYSKSKMVFIPNGFDTDKFRPDKSAGERLRIETGIPLNSPIIGLAARFDPVKDHQNFIDAAAIIHKDHPETHFLLCGMGITLNNPSLVKWIDHSGLSDNFHLLGERQDMPNFHAGLDVEVNCSYGESFPNAIGEAMACGVPCIVTDVGDMRQIVQGSGIIVPPRDSFSLAQACKELIEMSPTQRQALGTIGRELIINNFGMTMITSKFQELYRSLIKTEEQ